MSVFHDSEGLLYDKTDAVISGRERCLLAEQRR